MSNNMAKIADARKTVEQLKLEVNIERMMVSEGGDVNLDMEHCARHALFLHTCECKCKKYNWKNINMQLFFFKK